MTLLFQKNKLAFSLLAKEAKGWLKEIQIEKNNKEKEDKSIFYENEIFFSDALLIFPVLLETTESIKIKIFTQKVFDPLKTQIVKMSKKVIHSILKPVPRDFSSFKEFKSFVQEKQFAQFQPKIISSHIIVKSRRFDPIIQSSFIILIFIVQELSRFDFSSLRNKVIVASNDYNGKNPPSSEKEAREQIDALKAKIAQAKSEEEKEYYIRLLKQLLNYIKKFFKRLFRLLKIGLKWFFRAIYLYLVFLVFLGIFIDRYDVITERRHRRKYFENLLKNSPY